MHHQHGGWYRSTPPLTNINILSFSNGTSPHALLHQAYASCGRVFLLLLLALPFFIASCSQDDAESLTPMHQMYNESVTLTQVQMDSISNFCTKFCGYVNKHPQSKHDEYFTPTIENIRTAAALHGYNIWITDDAICITIDDEWDDEIIVKY